MANIPLQSITFPGLADKYTTPTVDSTLTQTGAAADAKKTGDEIAELKNDLNEKADKTEALSSYIVETETGAIASFTDGADGVPVKDLTVAIEPVQSGSGDPSPTNVRPISGWTGANVTACGVNVWDEQWETGGFDVNGNPTTVNSRIRSKNFIAVKHSTSLYFNGARVSWLEYDANKQYVGSGNGGSLIGPNVTFTPSSEASFIKFYTSASYGGTYNHDISINYPATDTAYHAYKGSSVSIDWTTEAGTVYGGTLDVTSGVLTVNRAMTILDENGSYSITFATDRNRIAWSGYESVGKTNGTFVASSLATIENASGGFGSGDWQIFGNTTTSRMWITVPTSIASVNAFKAYVESNPITVVYELATPQTYQLTPEEVSTVLGQNNIFADTGDVTVQYRADTKLYIDKVVNA